MKKNIHPELVSGSQKQERRSRNKFGMTLLMASIFLLLYSNSFAQDSTKVTDMPADTSLSAPGVFYYIESFTDKQMSWATMARAIQDTLANTTGDVTFSGKPLVSAIGTGKVTTVMLLDGTVGNADLGSNSVTTDKISTNTIVADDIITGGVTTTEILNNTITASDISPGSITGTEITNNSLTASDISTGGVTTTEILDGTVATTDYGDSTISQQKLTTALINYINAAGGGSITNHADDVTIQENADSTLSVKDLGVTYAKLNSDVTDKIIYAGDVRLFGADVSGDSVTNRTAIQNALDYASPLGATVVIAGGIYTVDTTIFIPSNIHLEIMPGSGLKIGANKNSSWLLSNSDTTNGNSNIVIDGGGILDGNVTNRTRLTNNPPYTSQTVLFMKVDNFTFKDIKIQNSLAFNFQASNIRNFLIDNIEFWSDTSLSNSNNDGIHITGPASYGTISNIRGVVTDNIVAVLADDWDHYYVTEGDVHDITIENIFQSDSSKQGGIRLLNDDHNTYNITIRNLYGGWDAFGVVGLSTYNARSGSFDNIRIENINANSGTVTQAIQISDSAIVNGLFIDGVYGGNFTKILKTGVYVDVENLEISNVDINIDYSSTGVNYLGTGASIKLLQFNNIKVSNNFATFVKYAGTGTIDRLIIDGFVADTSEVFLQLDPGAVATEVYLRNINADYITSSFFNTSGSTTLLELENIRAITTDNTINAIAPTSLATLTEVKISKAYFKGFSTVLTANKPLKLNANNITADTVKRLLTISGGSGHDYILNNIEMINGTSQTYLLYVSGTNTFTNFKLNGFDGENIYNAVYLSGTNTFTNISMKHVNVSLSGINTFIDNASALTVGTMKFDDIEIDSASIFINFRSSTNNITRLSFSKLTMPYLRKLIDVPASTTITDASLSVSDITIPAGYLLLNNLGTITRFKVTGSTIKFPSTNSMNYVVNNTGTILRLTSSGNSYVKAEYFLYAKANSVQSYIQSSGDTFDTLKTFMRTLANIGGGYKVNVSGSSFLNNTYSLFNLDSIATPTATGIMFKNNYYDKIGSYSDLTNANTSSNQLSLKTDVLQVTRTLLTPVAGDEIRDTISTVVTPLYYNGSNWINWLDGSTAP